MFALTIGRNLFKKRDFCRIYRNDARGRMVQQKFIGIADEFRPSSESHHADAAISDIGLL